MPKMTLSCKCHGNPKLIAGGNDIVVAYRPTGLNNRPNLMPVSFLDGIRHREKSIAGQKRTLGTQSCFVTGNKNRIDPRHLPGPDPDALTSLREDNGIGFYGFDALPSKDKILGLGIA